MSRENYPQGWAEFVSNLKIKGGSPSAPISVWAARFRVARSFTGITLDGMSETAEAGYFVGLKLTLVDTALEALEHAIGVDTSSISFTEPPIGARLWQERGGELTSAFDSLTNRKLRQALNDFLEADEAVARDFDLRIILRAFRHLTAHGEFTPSASGLYTSENFRSLLLELADAGLRHCEERFMEHFELGSSASEPEVDVEPAGKEVVLDLTGEDPDSPMMQGLGALLREDNLKKKAVFEEQRNAEALENIAKNDEGFLLFRERTSGISLEIVQADEVDQGDSRGAWEKIAKEREVSKDALTTTYVLGPPEEMLRLEKDAALREDDGFLEALRSQCLLYVTSGSVLFGNKYEWTTQTFGLLLKRTNFNEQKALNGWDVGRTPVLGNQPSLQTFVDEELLELPTLWSPAGSGNHYFSISPQRLLEITKGKPGPRASLHL